MRERPILMSAPMVRALLDGRKTQTRRKMKTAFGAGFWQPMTNGSWEWSLDGGFDQGVIAIKCPYGRPGDRLWVRETWTSAYQDGGWGTAFRADGAFVLGKRTHEKGPHFHAKELGDHVRWRSSMFMPRWASRITLEITEVRVQRLQEIRSSREDVMAEGISESDVLNCDSFYAWGAYRQLWESINGKGSWDLNPWVWALTFKAVA